MSNKSRSQILYDTYGKKMCLSPFLNSFYATTGVVNLDQEVRNMVRPCSVITSWSGADNFPWDIQNSNILESRNTPLWKRLRQELLNGNMNQLPECSTCNKAEEHGSSSPRQLNNDYMFEHLDIDIIAEVQRIIDADFVADRVHAIDYMPSNYCNYACVMCYAGASSQRTLFDIKNGAKIKSANNPVDADFFALLKDVKILGFTGGETILQPEVHAVMDYVIEHDLAQNMIITMLTNVSDFPDSLIEKFKKFKRVLYTVSIDGVGDVIEYQRRGSNWATVEKNVIKIHQTPEVHEIVNHVVTAINILSAMDFVDWCHANDMKFAAISAVFQHNKLGVAALPPELKELALTRLRNGRTRYEHYLGTTYNNYERNYVEMIDRLISTVENIEFDPDALKRFIKHIEIEDIVSKKPLREVVPEWAPWFV
jgi:MoaA/NifB/PqqE/SkfB family radical SAM enzyme